jgi:hypothetical protein
MIFFMMFVWFVLFVGPLRRQAAVVNKEGRAKSMPAGNKLITPLITKHFRRPA